MSEGMSCQDTPHFIIYQSLTLSKMLHLALTTNQGTVMTVDNLSPEALHQLLKQGRNVTVEPVP